MADLLASWTTKVAASDRVPSSWQEAIEQNPHAEALRHAGFDYFGKFEFTEARTWSIEALIGYVYSTSYLNRQALGDNIAAFEWDLTKLLSSFEPTGTLRATMSYAYEFAQAPG